MTGGDTTTNGPPVKSLTLTPATRDERPALENLFQLYTHDFSELWAGTERGEVDAEGRFSPYPLDAYWREPGWRPFLLRQGPHLAGFAMVNDHGLGCGPVDHNVAEFFVLRKYRRGGIGTKAAHLLFAERPGVWEAAVARRNVAALAFWRRAIAICPGALDLTEQDVQSQDWDGPVLRFRVV